MKGSSHTLSLAFCILTAIGAAQLIYGAESGTREIPGSPVTTRTNALTDRGVLVSRRVAERTKHTKTVETLRLVPFTNALGQAALKTNVARYNVLKNGMNHRDPVSGEWVECQPILEIQKDGTILGSGANFSVRIQGDLATSGCIDLTTPDHERIRMSLLSLGWFCPDSGRMQTIGVVTNAVAEVGSNTVTFRQAFDRVAGSVVYSYEAGKFSQWIVVEEKLDPPAWAGPRVRLEATTEIVEASAWTNTTKVVRREQDAERRKQVVEPDLTDDLPRVGRDMVMVRGKAFAIGGGVATKNPPAEANVYKQVLDIGRRKVLIEAVELKQITKELQKLPIRTASAAIKSAPTFGRQIPAPLLARSHDIQRKPILVAQAALPAGLCVDYTIYLRYPV